MPKSIINSSYCCKCGCLLTFITDDSEIICDDCKDEPMIMSNKDDDGGVIINDFLEEEIDYFEDDDFFRE